MIVSRLTLLAAAASLALTACSVGATTAPAITQVSPTSGKLQFAVGTANLYGGSTALNVVSTFRQADGRSAVGANTPTILGPFAFGVGAAPAAGSGFSDWYTSIPNAGPSLPETLLASPAITGTPQTVVAGTPPCDTLIPNDGSFTTCPSGFSPNATSFGQSGGVFAMGIAPYNIVPSSGQSFSYQPYTEPIYDNGGGPPTFAPWGGPPAFDPDGNGMGTRDGLIALGFDSFGFPYFLGVGEGLTVFEGVTPGSGMYTLKAAISTIGGGGAVTTSTLSTSATMNAAVVLPAVSAPLVTPDANGDGGATFTVTLPAGATEGLVQIVDYGPGGSPSNGVVANCQGPKGTNFAPVYYTVPIPASGNYVLPASDGPNTNLSGGAHNLTPSHSICTAVDNTSAAAGDNFIVQYLAFDYPIYEAAHGLISASPPESPSLAGPAGQADVTISNPVEEDWTSSGYTATTLTHSIHSFGREHIKLRSHSRLRRSRSILSSFS